MSACATFEEFPLRRRWDDYSPKKTEFWCAVAHGHFLMKPDCGRLSYSDGVWAKVSSDVILSYLLFERRVRWCCVASGRAKDTKKQQLHWQKRQMEYFAQSTGITRMSYARDLDQVKNEFWPPLLDGFTVLFCITLTYSWPLVQRTSSSWSGPSPCPLNFPSRTTCGTSSRKI